MKKRIGIILLCISMVVSLAACGMTGSKEQNTQVSNTEGSVASESIAFNSNDSSGNNIYEAVTDFAVRLLQTEQLLQKELLKQTETTNVLLSPFSILTALSMTANGAQGETREQIENTFGTTIESLNQFIAYSMPDVPMKSDAAMDSLEEDAVQNGLQEPVQGHIQDTEREITSNSRRDVSVENKFHMANSIWYTEDARFTVKEDFLDINAQYYGADIYEASFDDETVGEINQWVEKNTDGLIKEILNEIPADAVMYLINTLVFDAKWEKTYEKTDIREGVFTVVEGIEQKAELMYSDEYAYLEDEYATGFVKYYKGRDYAFVALLPKEEITLQEYINTLSGEQLHKMISNPQEIMVHTWIPQFKTEYQVELREILREMGMKDLFDASKSDLSLLGTSSNGNLFVDRVIHKTYIEVSPTGTKAGAATAVEVKDECAVMEPENVKEVCLDRPFLYMIIDCENNQPIFMGTVNYVDAYRCGVEDICSYPVINYFHEDDLEE